MQSELKKGHSIFNFKKGDILIKVNPTIFSNGINDRSFMDVPHELIYIENSLIYLECKEGFHAGRRYTANLSDYCDGWIKYTPIGHEENLNFKDFIKSQIENWFFDDSGLLATKETIKGFLHKIHLDDKEFFTEEQTNILSN